MADQFHYAACDYFATGEGTTVCVLISRPEFIDGDYAERPVFSFETGYNPGKLRDDVTAETVMARKFKELFGEYYSIGIEHLSRDEFLKRFARFVPDIVIRMSDPQKEGPPPGPSLPLASAYQLFVSIMEEETYIVPSSATYKWVATPSTPVPKQQAPNVLKDVSTRELLNEAYRRRAIEKFDFNFEVNSLLTGEEEYFKTLHEHMLKDFFSHVLAKDYVRQKAISETEVPAIHGLKGYKFEIYICRHPTNVKTDAS